MTEILEGEYKVIEEGEAVEIATQWAGPSPFFLVIELDDRSNGNVGIDLDTPGWVAANTEYMRAPGTWWLINKGDQRPMLSLIVHDGDQPYFTKHHTGNLMAGSEILTYGLGKKCADGSMVRLWLFANGMVCGGDDVDVIAARMLG